MAHTVRLGGPERAHASKALEQVWIVDVCTQKSQYYVLGALWLLHVGWSLNLAQA